MDREQGPDVEITSISKESIVHFLNNRELGTRKAGNRPLRTKLSYGTMAYAYRPLMGKGKRALVLKSHWDIWVRGTNILLSDYGEWLIGVRTSKARNTGGFVFCQVQPNFLDIVYRLNVEDVPSNYLMEFIFPPKEQLFVAVLVTDKDMIDSAKMDRSVTSEAVVHMLIPCVEAHVSIGMLYLSTNRGLKKGNQRSHILSYLNGFIVNTGATIVSIGIYKERPVEHNRRKIFPITTKTSQSEISFHRKDIDLGEYVTIAPTSQIPGYPLTKQPMFIEDNEKGQDVELFLTRETLDIDDIIYRMVTKELLVNKKFPGATTKGYIDYELIMRGIDRSGEALIAIIAACEVEISVNAEERQIIYVAYDIQCFWDLPTGKIAYVTIEYLKTLTAMDAMRNRWYPHVSTYPKPYHDEVDLNRKISNRTENIFNTTKDQELHITYNVI